MIDFACKKLEIDEVIKCSLSLTKSELTVLRHLMKSKEAFSSKGLSEEINIDLTTSQRALKGLREKGLVKRMQKNLSPGGYVFYYSVINNEEIKEKMMNIIREWVKRVEKELSRL